MQAAVTSCSCRLATRRCCTQCSIRGRQAMMRLGEVMNIGDVVYNMETVSIHVPLLVSDTRVVMFACNGLWSFLCPPKKIQVP